MLRSLFRESIQPLAQGQGWHRFWFQSEGGLPALSALRISVGLVGLYYQLSFLPDLVRWFGPYGLLPIELVTRLIQDETSGFVFRPSLLMWNESPLFLWITEAIACLAWLAFAAGCLTRLSGLLALLLTLSFIHRAPMISGPLEPVLTMLMFYLAFTRCGAHWSIDALRRREPAATDSRAARATWLDHLGLRLIQVHLAGFYLVLALNKLSGEPWWNGEATWWLAAHTETRLVDLTVLHRHPFLFHAWTHGTVLFELLFPVLIWNRLARPLLLAASVVSWGLLSLIIGQVAFCLLMVLAGTAYLPFVGLARDERSARAFSSGRSGSASPRESVTTAGAG